MIKSQPQSAKTKRASCSQNWTRRPVAFELKASVAQNSKTFARESLASHVTELTEAGPMNGIYAGGNLYRPLKRACGAYSAAAGRNGAHDKTRFTVTW